MDPRLEPLLSVPDGFERRLAFVALLSEEFRRRGASAPIIVGGHAVEIFTRGHFPTRDIDVVVDDAGALAAICADLGLDRRGRFFFEASLALAIEAPGSELPERIVEVEVGSGLVRVASAEDLVIDRLNALVHWRSERDGDIAVALLAIHGPRLDARYLDRRAREEDVANALDAARRRAAGGGATA